MLTSHAYKSMMNEGRRTKDRGQIKLFKGPYPQRNGDF